MKKSNRIFGIQTIEVILQQHPECITKLLVQRDTANKRILKIVDIASTHGIAIDWMQNHGKHSRKASYALLAECKSMPRFDEASLYAMAQSDDNVTFVVLDGITDPHNLGAILRTAAAMGINAVIAPKNNSVGLTPTVRNVACGGAEMLPFIPVSNLARSLRELKDLGIWIYGADANSDNLLTSVKFPNKIAMVFGGEHNGVKRLTRELCDEMLQIPLSNGMDSLNVSVAAGMFIYQAMQR